MTNSMRIDKDEKRTMMLIIQLKKEYSLLGKSELCDNICLLDSWATSYYETFELKCIIHYPVSEIGVVASTADYFRFCK